MKKSSSKYILISAVIAAFLLIVGSVAGLVILNNINSQKDYNFITGVIPNKSIDMSVKNPTTSEVKRYNADAQEGENVFTFMKDLQDKNKDFKFSYSESQYGIFVTGINGYEASNDKKEFWKLFVNNEVSQVGIVDYVIQKGDSLRWEIDNF